MCTHPWVCVAGFRPAEHDGAAEQEGAKGEGTKGGCAHGQGAEKASRARAICISPQHTRSGHLGEGERDAKAGSLGGACLIQGPSSRGAAAASWETQGCKGGLCPCSSPRQRLASCLRGPRTLSRGWPRPLLFLPHHEVALCSCVLAAPRTGRERSTQVKEPGRSQKPARTRGRELSSRGSLRDQTSGAHTASSVSPARATSGGPQCLRGGVPRGSRVGTVLGQARHVLVHLRISLGGVPGVLSVTRMSAGPPITPDFFSQKCGWICSVPSALSHWPPRPPICL